MIEFSEIINAYRGAGHSIEAPDDLSLKINSITSDSRNIVPGALFVAITGHSIDGHQYVKKALASGAVAAIVSNKEFSSDKAFTVDDSRRFLSFAASYIAGEPSKKIKCIGITGTNGKTSISYILEHLCKDLVPSVIGTVSHRCNGKEWKTKLTTPAPEDLHERINDFIEEKSSLCIMEVSSIAIDQSRTEDISFNGYIYTNLTHDHMDYHKTWENYVNSKERLFSDYPEKSIKKNQWAILNGDDGAQKNFKFSEKLKVIRYGFDAGNDCICEMINSNIEGMEFKITYEGKDFTFKTSLIGRHNVYNLVASLLGANELGIDLEDLSEKVKSFSGIPGRLQKVITAPSFFVDYAHTDDALRNVLKTLNKEKQDGQKLVTIFGCGGDRDKGKRPKMMEAADSNSDIVIVTSDNPRTESPGDIIKDIIADIDEARFDKEVYLAIDRKSAIELAFKIAHKNDIVLVAGKGHEDYQEVNGQREFFDDALIIKEIEARYEV